MYVHNMYVLIFFRAKLYSGNLGRAIKTTKVEIRFLKEEIANFPLGLPLKYECL